MVTIYGIKNCDTMKKAFKLFDDNGIAYEFHDYKKSAPDTSVLQSAIDAHGWDNVINKRGTTWRKLPDDIKEKTNKTNAIDLCIQNPSIIKRPLIVKDCEILLGYDMETYKNKLI